jgi:hypothetical protein
VSIDGIEDIPVLAPGGPPPVNPLRDGVSLPELVKLTDAAAAEGAPSPLRPDWLAEKTGPVRGHVMWLVAVYYLIVRDEAHGEDRELVEYLCMGLGAAALLASLPGLWWDWVPVWPLIAAGLSLNLAAGLNVWLRYMAGGEPR